MEKRWVLEPERPRERLDLFLVSVGAGPSRSGIQRIIRAGSVLVNGRAAQPSALVGPGDEIVVHPPDPALSVLEPEDIPLGIVYEDRDLLVVDKPRGMVVHPAAGNEHGTLVHALLAHCADLSGINGVIRPGIVHRLDKDTTGLLVVAKNDLTHLGLASQLSARTMARTYLALVHGVPQAHGRIEMPIGRHPVHRQRMAVVPGGRPAVTIFHLLEPLGCCSLLALNLLTGRTHQIRVHLAAVGHAVLGDPVYGRRAEVSGLAGQALHAARLAFVHPRTGERMEFRADPPADFRHALSQARLLAGIDPDTPIPV